MNLGIPNYSGKFVHEHGEILSLYNTFANEVIGKTIRCSWIAILKNDGRWLKGLPIVLNIDHENYEICWMKFSDVSITKNLIDIHQPFNWMNSEDEELLCDWKKDELPILQSIVGQSITKVQILEAEHSFGENLIWMPNGIEFTLSNGYLSIFNNLDENGIADLEWQGDHYRLVEVI
jgi:hypothetical protein